MALTPATKDADDKLRQELEHADIGKFKKAVKKVLSPAKSRQKAVKNGSLSREREGAKRRTEESERFGKGNR